MEVIRSEFSFFLNRFSEQLIFFSWLGSINEEQFKISRDDFTERSHSDSPALAIDCWSLRYSLLCSVSAAIKYAWQDCAVRQKKMKGVIHSRLTIYRVISVKL